jgi:multidrug resistance efflux pump
MTHDKPDLERLIERLRKMAVCIYIAVEAEVAKDIADGLEKAAAALETLSARLEEAEGRAEHLKVCFDEAMGQVSAAQTRAERAEQEAKGLRKDAERYRWLRKYGATLYNDVFNDDMDFSGVEAGAKQLDSAIDAALAGKEGNNMQAALQQEKPQGGDESHADNLRVL